MVTASENLAGCAVESITWVIDGELHCVVHVNGVIKVSTRAVESHLRDINILGWGDTSAHC